MKQLFIILLTFLFCNTYAQEIVNGSFEIENTQKLPLNWKFYGDPAHYKLTVNKDQYHSGNKSVHIDGRTYEDASLKNGAIYANAYGLLSSKKIKKIYVSAYIKMDHQKDSAVALFVQDFSGENIIRKFVTVSRLAKWNKVVLEYTPSDTNPWYGFYYGVELSKDSDFWIDTVSLSVDDEKIKDPEAFKYNPDKKDIAWLNKNSLPLKTIESGSDFTDLERIGNLFGDSQIIGIGEPTHGTSEASKIKLRMLEYLVTNKGFSTFALEENIPVCDALNDIINNKDLSLKESLLSLPFYKCWKNQEVLDVFEWIRNYNVSHNNKVKFIGIDMEDSWIASSLKSIKPYTLKDDSILKIYAKTESDINALKLANKQQNKNDTNKFVDELLINLENLTKIITESKTITTEDQFKLNSYVRVSSQWLSSRFLFNESSKTRDEYMATNLSFYFQNHPEEKIMLWAHNTHIANNRSNQKTMGAYLKDFYAKKYSPIAITSAQGFYTAAEDYTQKTWKSYPFVAAYKGTYEFILQKSTSPLYFISMLDTKQVKWLNMPMQLLDKGYIYAEGPDYNFTGSNLSMQFDGMFFCKATSASKSLLN
ncbi:erythromycin esterase family protein [Flavobacterium sp. '19STA2R22 D10 B1']|uniref:erythromycin esterase family protein n=1 Tax=Flavobacterium aerium TaxID=3037261 RepID=UPI00278C0681|nr:erythromycin esterase family protein [Flavobacterium sp. '19STA2R22 D10 B1']